MPFLSSCQIILFSNNLWNLADWIPHVLVLTVKSDILERLIKWT